VIGEKCGEFAILIFVILVYFFILKSLFKNFMKLTIEIDFPRQN